MYNIVKFTVKKTSFLKITKSNTVTTSGPIDRQYLCTVPCTQT